jgi:hypothetical protein
MAPRGASVFGFITGEREPPEVIALHKMGTDTDAYKVAFAKAPKSEQSNL